MDSHNDDTLADLYWVLKMYFFQLYQELWLPYDRRGGESSRTNVITSSRSAQKWTNYCDLEYAHKVDKVSAIYSPLP